MKKSVKGPEGVQFNGRFIPLWAGVYDGMTTAFFRGGLPNISRTIKCDDTACVCVEYDCDEEDNPLR